VAAFKKSELTHDGSICFLNQLSALGPGSLDNPLIYFLAVTMAYTYPEEASPFIVEWATNPRGSGTAASTVPKIVTMLTACGTARCGEIVVDILCKSDPDIVRQVLSANMRSLRSSEHRLLVERLGSLEPAPQYERALLIRFALTGNVSESELLQLRRSLLNGYVKALAQDRKRDPELELRLVCMMTPIEHQVPEIDEMDETVLAEVAPAALQHISFRRELRVFMDKLTNGSAEDYDCAFDMLSGGSDHVSRQPPDELSPVIYFKCRGCADFGAAMKILWHKASTLVQEGRHLSAFRLVYLARRIQIESGRRWLSCIEKYPWE
jgi:hypothetical protein